MKRVRLDQTQEEQKLSDDGQSQSTRIGVDTSETPLKNASTTVCVTGPRRSISC
jgi:hypothetical protein